MPFIPISDPRLSGKLTIEKDIVIETDPKFPDAVRIDGVLVSVVTLLHIFRPDPDPRMWFRFARIPSPGYPGEDIITVHTETREVPSDRRYYDGQLVIATSRNHPRSIVSAELWKGEWMYRLANCLGMFRESDLRPA